MTFVGPQQSPLAMITLLRRIWRHWLLLMILAIAGSLVGMALSRFQTPAYEAEALLVVELDINARPLEAVADVRPDWLISTESDILRSQPIIEAALRRLPNAPAEASHGEAKQSLSLADRAKSLGGNLRIDHRTESLAIRLSFRSESAKFSAAFLNAIAQAYIDEKAALIARARADTELRLQSRQDDLSRQIEVALADIERLEREPRAQARLQTRRLDLADLEQASLSVALQLQSLTVDRQENRIWFVSPASPPAEPDQTFRNATIVSCALLPIALAILGMMIRGGAPVHSAYVRPEPAPAAGASAGNPVGPAQLEPNAVRAEDTTSRSDGRPPPTRLPDRH